MKTFFLNILKLENRMSLFSYIIIIAIMATVFYSGYTKYVRNNLLGEKSTYVIATYIQMTNGPTAQFEYSFRNTKYYLEQGYECGRFSLGKRFYAQIHPNNPTIAKISYLRTIPDSIVSQPFNGWKSLPPIDITLIPRRDCFGSFPE